METNIIILEGWRGEEKQNRAWRTGASKLKYPHSKHNRKPSFAVDVAPYPLNWQDIESFKELAIVIKKHIRLLGLENISWGGDWKTFKDYPHWEIK